MKVAHAVLGACAAAFLTSACGTIPPTARPAAMTADALRAVPRLMDEAIVPGMQIGVISGGRIETRSFGVRDVQTGAPVTDDTVFEAASLSKPVLAYAVLRLASTGRIDLDAPVASYCRASPAPWPSSRRGSSSVTLPGCRTRPGVLRLPHQ
jgi:CubicO group peptidase (beta-lactamase class C family)